VTVFIDTSVIMYAGGAEHPLRQPCRDVMRRIVTGDLDAATSTEVVQEILHRFARGRRPIGVRMARGVLELFGDVVAVDRTIMVDALRQYEQSPGVSSRDAVHAATCRVHGIDHIVSVDAGFDAVADIIRVHPSELATG
jgi:uncharacterized protein